MTDPCGVSEEQLWSWIDRQAPELEEHLAGCALCRGRAEEIESLLEVVASDGRPPQLPETIGPFRILRLLGEGATGRVFEAEQDEPRRKVAVKVLKGGRMASADALKFFVREVSSLARLRHPGIAQIHQAGHTDDGHHWFAMELVDGVPVTQYAVDRGLGLRARLQLFRQLCYAVHSAHGRGIIHRDLKPGNILVAEEDGAPAPKILDFGLAHDDLAGPRKLSLTRTGQVVGTLPYMAPEQVRGEHELVDIRTDVYALGVIFYELLCGELPYEVPPSSLTKAVRVINEVQPARLQGRAAGVGFEIEAIVFKALDKDPERRYLSAAALAEDVERYLADVPVLAKPPSRIYQASKFIKRHRLLTALVATVFAIVLGFSIKVKIDADRIQEENEKVAQLVGVMFETFSTATYEQMGPDTPVVEFLPALVASIGGRLEDFPELEAPMRRALGMLHRDHGKLVQARAEFEAAISLLEGDPVGNAFDIAKSRIQLAVVAREQGQLDEAAQLARQAIAVFRAQDESELYRVGMGLVNLARTLVMQRRLDEAEAACREALPIQERNQSWKPEGYVGALVTMGRILIRQDRWADAEVQLRAALAMQLHHDTSSGKSSPNVASVMINLAWALRMQAKSEEAIDLCQRAYAIDAQVYGEQHDRVGRDRSCIAKAVLADPEPSRELLEMAVREFQAAIGVFDRHRGGRPQPKWVVVELEEARELLGRTRELLAAQDEGGHD